MDFYGATGSELRFAAYVDGLASVIGHKDRIVRYATIARG